MRSKRAQSLGPFLLISHAEGIGGSAQEKATALGGLYLDSWG